MSWSEDSVKSLRSRVAQVEEVYEWLVSSLKKRVKGLEGELGGVKDRIVDLQDTVYSLHGEVGCLQTDSGGLREVGRHVQPESDIQRSLLLQIRSLLDQCEAFQVSPVPEVVGATVVQTESPDSFLSYGHEDSDTPTERPPFVNSAFLKKLGDMLMQRTEQVTADQQPSSPRASPRLSASVPPPHISPSSASSPSLSSPSPTSLPLRSPPPPPPPIPPSFRPPTRTHVPRAQGNSQSGSLARHCSPSTTPLPAPVPGDFRRYCLVTQGCTGTGGLQFRGDDTHTCIYLKSHRRDQVYQFDKVFKNQHEANSMPEALKKDIKGVPVGKDVCVVVFGHSYTGKTRLVLGARRKHGNVGLLCKTVKKLMKRCQRLKNAALKICACEIFSGETRDLLKGHSGEGRHENTWDSRPATWMDVVSIADVRVLSRIIWDRRRVRAECFPPSSASHLLLTLTVVRAGAAAGRMVLADLAGFRTHTTKGRSEADRYINFSLKDLVFALSGKKYDSSSLLVQLLNDFLTGPRAAMYIICCLGQWEGQEDANYLALHHFGK